MIDLDKNHILLIDDSEIDRARMSFLLKSENNIIYPSETVNKAISLLDKHEFSLAICDIQMPDKDGFEFARIMKQNDKTKDIPILFVSSSKQSEELLLKVYDLGGVELLDKFENIDLIKKKVDVFLAIANYRKKLHRLNSELETQKEMSDVLLENILPESTIQQLKESGKVKPKKYNLATVLFTDFVGFTEIAHEVSPEELITKLEFYFSKFDEILEHFNVEKIKTIGDAYMCVGGIPIKNKSNPIDAVLAALSIKEFVHSQKEKDIKNGIKPWRIRIGIHTGELIAGIIGTKKYAYDVWGGSVNTASRIESAAEPNSIVISGSTKKYIKKYIETELIGDTELKGLGIIELYKVLRISKKYSKDKQGILPNKQLKIDFFEDKFSLIQV
tara:strand:+ start:1085 stop:2248 length:1164 start_codon:yes stop_codon:yes gene_type:complete